MQLGSIARDQDGNEYVLCAFDGPVFGGVPVEIDSDFTCRQLGTTGRGRVGVACGVGTSDEIGWVQIYGLCNIQLGMSGVSPSDAANGPTTLDTSIQTFFRLGTSLTSPNGIGWASDHTSLLSGHIVENIFVASGADLSAVSAVTSAASHVGNQCLVFLNYPTIVYRNFGE